MAHHATAPTTSSQIGARTPGRSARSRAVRPDRRYVHRRAPRPRPDDAGRRWRTTLRHRRPRLRSELERRAGRPVHELFDLIVGTSTGALLGLGLTTPAADGAPRYGTDDLVSDRSSNAGPVGPFTSCST